MITATERLMRLFRKHRSAFSIEGLPDGKVHITVSNDYGSFQDVAGGDFDNLDEGINECINQLETRARKRSIKEIK